MNPEEQNQQPPTPQEVNPTAHAYNSGVTNANNGKKFVVVAAMILMGVIALAVIAVLAYNSTGERTEDRIEELNTELGEPLDNSDTPSTE